MMTLCPGGGRGRGVSRAGGDGPRRALTVRRARGGDVSGALPSVAYPCRVADRGDLSSWLGGGPAPDPGSRRGGRLGLLEDGPGSLAPLGRRFVALVIDWVACLAISGAFF